MPPKKRKSTKPRVYPIGSKKKPIMYGGARRMMHHHAQHGYGFFDSIGNFFKKTLPNVARKVGSFVKDNKILSRGLSLIPHPAAGMAGKVAGMVGLGRAQSGLSFWKMRSAYFSVKTFFFLFRCGAPSKISEAHFATPFFFVATLVEGFWQPCGKNLCSRSKVIFQ